MIPAHRDSTMRVDLDVNWARDRVHDVMLGKIGAARAKSDPPDAVARASGVVRPDETALAHAGFKSPGNGMWQNHEKRAPRACRSSKQLEA